jgi:hypothetical protein
MGKRNDGILGKWSIGIRRRQNKRQEKEMQTFTGVKDRGCLR